MAEEEVQTVVNEGTLDVMIGDLILPIPPRQMRIRKSAKIDEIEIPGRSGKVKMAVGYEDAVIELSLEVCAEESGGKVVRSARQRVEVLFAMFRPTDDPVPTPVPIVSTLTEALRIKSVLVKDFSVNDNPDFDYYNVKLALVEFESIENQLDHVEARQEVIDDQVAQDPRLEEAMGEQEDSYLIEQAERGYESANTSFDGNAPGVDNG